MTAIRLGLVFLAFGVGLLIAGTQLDGRENLLDIGAVGCIVFGAVAICIATEAKSSGTPPRAKQEGRIAKRNQARRAAR